MNSDNYNIHYALKTILSSTYFNEYKYLDWKRIKSEYRKKAMLLHPDRVKITGKNIDSISEKFITLNNAYHLVSPFFKSRKYISIPYIKPYFKQHSKQYSRKNYKTYHDINRKRKRTIPKLKLRLCRFLYYKGIINYKTIIDALVWQLQNRPKVGEIALKNKFITFDKILKIIKTRNIGEKFLEAAVRLNYINNYHVKHIFRIQESYNVPIGKYFLENKILTRNELHSILKELQNHNLKH